MIYKECITALILFLQVLPGLCQGSEIDILNSIISDLVGEQKNADIPVFSSINEACRSPYIICLGNQTKIIGLDFQYTNLNGHIPKEISKLKDLRKIFLDYNYLSGSIPNSLTKLRRLQEITLKGNFLTGPIPDNFHKVARYIDLAKNTIENASWKDVSRLNIVDQINLKGRRSPDSIFLNSPLFTDSIPAITTKKDVLKSDGKMPSKTDCENENYTKSVMNDFIYEHMEYPHSAIVNRVEGIVDVEFDIDATGEINNVQLVRDIGGRCGNAGLWIVNRINFTSEGWKSGLKACKKVKVRYTLPIKFKLDDLPASKPSGENIFNILLNRSIMRL